MAQTTPTSSKESSDFEVILKENDQLLVRNFYTHIVQKDETIEEISEFYNHRVSGILKSNPWLYEENRVVSDRK